MIVVEDKERTAKTMTDAVKPLLTSMKLFGLYFRSAECETGGGKVADEKSRRRWNGCTIYALVVVIFMWINVVRMFSVFRNTPIQSLLISSFRRLFDFSLHR